MTDEIGCEFRELCEVYGGDYKESPIVSPNYKKICDNTPRESFERGLCPVYDFYSGIFSLIADSMRRGSKTLDRMIRNLDEHFKKMDEIEKSFNKGGD